MHRVRLCTPTLAERSGSPVDLIEATLLQSVYSGDAVKSKAIGMLSADPVNAHIDAILIKRTRRARPSSHSYAMLSPPSAK
jgi:hypothetical protein